ncbi:helix-turn-helix transcriptional regulator [Sporosarcina sp. Marseille-Q4943]|uniref:helix-turn-helix transcriptional regulator n=1 Tax=Sporosarcina sp. Marseille-Q4943 TaxID=2942204 RepID=UPI00208DC161|nr:helix-turn-helix transcriptional regulator [Sporosarcina sp. Marseille-Q4943]
MDNDLKKVLIGRRTELGYSHQQIADEVSISRQFYGMIENGERRPSVEVAKKIGRVMDLDWQIFFESIGNYKLQKGVG